MNKRMLAFMTMLVLLLCVLTVGVSAGSTNERYQVGYAKRDINPYIFSESLGIGVKDLGDLAFDSQWTTEVSIQHPTTGATTKERMISVPLSGYANSTERPSSGIIDDNGDGYTGLGDGLHITCTTVTDPTGVTLVYFTIDAISGYTNVLNDAAAGVTAVLGNTVRADISPTGGGNGTVQQGQFRIAHHQHGIHLQLAAKTGTGGAGTEGIIEREHARRQFLDGDAALVTGVVLGKREILLFTQQIHHDNAAGQSRGRFHRVGQALLDIGTDDQTVHHHLDGMLFILLQRDLLAQLIEIAVHPNADIAAATRIVKDLGMLAFPSPDHGSENLDARALRQHQNLVDDLVDGLLADLTAALGTVGRTDPRPQKAQIVIDLRHRTYRGTGIFTGGLLVDGNGRGKTVDIIHIRLIHLPEEHTGIGTQALHIAALTLCIDRIKRQRRFAAAG